MMEANNFITKLKGNDSATNIFDLRIVFDDYKKISAKLSSKDRGPFSLNVLCTFCRNLEQVPSWKDKLDNQLLLVMSIDCVRETRILDRDDRVKTLACIYRILRHAVKQDNPVPPELILKISYMPFELESKHLLQEYFKTYKTILTDRIMYIEQLKVKVNIIKFLPKLTEDINKLIDIYDTSQFCSEIFVYLVKKMHMLFSAHPKYLSQAYLKIFTRISQKNDVKLFKDLPEKDVVGIYVKLIDSLNTVIENAMKIDFKDTQMNIIVEGCITLMGDWVDLRYCLQTFYLSPSSCINKNGSYMEIVLSRILNLFEAKGTDKHDKAILTTYPYLTQIVRLYIEDKVTNSATKPWKEHFDIQTQKKCLKIIYYSMNILRHCKQLVKCENCHVNTGLHDLLRLSFLIKSILSVSLSQNLVITDILSDIHAGIMNQYANLSELKKLKCPNFEKCFNKHQTDVHNLAIALNKAQYYESAVKLFETYLWHEINSPENDTKNISRGLYNKSICQLDCQLYEVALIDAYLSLVFSPDIYMDKYMNLIMDIKAKELKSRSKQDEDEELSADDIQITSVLDACKMALDKQMYGNLKPFLSTLNFSEILKHEYSTYARLWPAMTPIAGVLKSLLALSKAQHGDWLSAEPKEKIEQTLYEVILETPSVVRTIHNKYLTAIVDKLLDTFDSKPKLTRDEKLVHASLLLLKFEYDLAEASQKYKWKTNEPIRTMDPDQVCANRTIPQEHGATNNAIRAVTILTTLSKDIQLVRKQYLSPALQIVQVFVPQLLVLSRHVQALQLSHICLRIAGVLLDDEAYIHHLGTLLYNAPAPCLALDALLNTAGSRGQGRAGAALLLCNAAVYINRCGKLGTAARLLQLAHAQILATNKEQQDFNYELAVGRLLEAASLLCDVKDTSALSVVNGIQRYYLGISCTGNKWTQRRLNSLTLRVETSRATLKAARLSRCLLLMRRARAAVAVALCNEPAAKRATLYVEITDTSSFDDAQIKIDNRLKHVLGLQPSNETQPYYSTTSKKQPPFTPSKQDIEPMRDSMVMKKVPLSPTFTHMSVPTFKMPEFFKHDSKCSCYACEIPLCLILACKTSGLEASTYARANETEIAKNYFEGVLEMFTAIEKKMVVITKKYKKVYEDFIVDAVMKNYEVDIKRMHIEVLMELSYFELKNNNYDQTDDHIVNIHEILQEIKDEDKYLTNEVMNLVTTSARLKNVIKKPEETGLEAEFEGLKLSPGHVNVPTEPPKTPESNATKPPAPAAPKIIVKTEELPIKCKVIKFNLDDSPDDEDFEKPTRKTRATKKADFKVPNPITAKPTLEIATPRPSRSVPKVLVTQPSKELATPKPLEMSKSDFFTPESTPDQFFTPMTSVKTYKKKSLHQNIVKNLEKEFSTPKTDPNIDKENIASSSRERSRKPREKTDVLTKSLKRATSPGKLPSDKKEPVTRTRRLRRNVKLSLEEDDKT